MTTRYALLALALLGCQESAAGTEFDIRAAKESSDQCGEKGLPDCPTQQWMKATLQSYVKQEDFERLEAPLSELATRGPREYSSWTAIAVRGAEAARARNAQGVRASCKECHDQWRSEFRSEYRSRVLFE